MQPLDYDTQVEPKATGDITRVVSVFLSAVMLLAVSGIFWRIYRDSPTNHMGFDPRTLYVLSVVGAAWGVIAFFIPRCPRCYVMLTLGTCAVFSVCIYVIDHFNLMVQYSDWLKRGMPVRWVWTR